MKFLAFLLIGINAFAVSAQNDSSVVKISVNSTNLSEDLSVASSKNDELMLIIYESPDGIDELNEPIFITKFTFDDNRMSSILEWKLSSISGKFIFFLIERDSERTELQIDPVLRIHSENIIDCFDQRDYLCIEKYLDDEDLLGYGKFQIPSSHLLNGVYKLDKFSYSITFQNR